MECMEHEGRVWGDSGTIQGTPSNYKGPFARTDEKKIPLTIG